MGGAVGVVRFSARVRSEESNLSDEYKSRALLMGCFALVLFVSDLDQLRHIIRRDSILDIRNHCADEELNTESIDETEAQRIWAVWTLG